MGHLIRILLDLLANRCRCQSVDPPSTGNITEGMPRHVTPGPHSQLRDGLKCHSEEQLVKKSKSSRLSSIVG
ncbi:hypothetical protein RB195_005557 [Necator americanus]|uniref:Uncharacterized protein n=1 Tax=Necator americanus TaxID=51031 RepID=A0ABR1BRU6_NECAM